jgi:Flp pilus assembly protein TadG
MSNLLKETSNEGIAGVKRRAGLFAKAEEGAMIIFGLIFFVIMLLAGGMAVDFIRFEHERAQVQYTLDRSILAAAALQQPLNPKDVVEDYFDKSDLKNYNLTVTPDTGLNYRTVTANADTTMNTFFVNMLGIDDMKASARGAAEERIPKVEISLVLDVSGSMGNNSKLSRLKTAAKEFVNTLLTAQNQDLVSISIVPYNMQVNAGQDILDEMPVTNEHSYSHCVDFRHSEYNATALNLTSGNYQRTGHFDPFFRNSTSHPNTSYDDNFNRLFMCPTTPESEIMLFSQDISALEDKIDDLVAGGNTSIDIGVRWGSAFLDPSTQPIVEDVPGVPAVFQDRPRPFTDEDVIKVLVVMTDGINTTQYTLDNNFKSGSSNIWYDPDSTWMGVREWSGSGADSNGDGHRDNATFFNSDLYYFDNDGNGYDDKYWSNVPHNVTEAQRLTWPEVWNLMSTRYNAFYHHYVQNWNANDYYDWRDDVTNYVSGSTKNNRLNTACSAAKNNEMVVFTIGFEVTNSSANVMKNCASSESHFFKVEGVQISSAFNAIAKTIQRLKLTH